MNKSLAIIIAVGLALGCDDPAVQAAIDVALDHGAVSAFAKCNASGTHTIDTGNIGSVGHILNDLRFEFARLADGSGMVTVTRSANNYGQSMTRFVPRSDGDVGTLKTAFASASCEIALFARLEGGDLVLTQENKIASPCSSVPDPYTFFSEPIDTVCTGFNLEAFN